MSRGRHHNEGAARVGPGRVPADRVPPDAEPIRGGASARAGKAPHPTGSVPKWTAPNVGACGRRPLALMLLPVLHRPTPAGAIPARHLHMTPQQPPVELWLVDLTRCAPPLEALERDTPRLADDDRERAGAIRDATTRRERITAYTALRVLLERAAGPAARRTRLVRSRAGAPRLAEGRVRFSLSHTDGFALIGLADALAVGVDLERPRPVRIAQRRRDEICAAAAGLRGAPWTDADPDRAMLQAWVRLEAFTKARGLALIATLADLGLRGARPPTASLADLESAARQLAHSTGLAIYDVGLPCGLQGAMAVGSGGCLPSPRDFPADREGLNEVLQQPWPSLGCRSASRIGLTC